MDLIVVVALFVMCVSYFMRRSLARRRDLRVRSDAASLRKVEAIAAAYRAAR